MAESFDGLREYVGTRVRPPEFGVVQGRKGSQALQVLILDPVPSVVRLTESSCMRISWPSAI